MTMRFLFAMTLCLLACDSHPPESPGTVTYYQHITNAPSTESHFGHRLREWDLGDDGVYFAVPGMGGFSLEFLDSDNHVGAMVVGGVSSGPSGLNYEDYRLGLGDRDSGDPVRMTAKYFSLSVQLRGPPPRPRPTFSVTGRADGRGSALAGIPRLAADELLVLRGFAIQTLRGNHHLRAVGVRHLRERNAISVTFADDSPEDDGFAFSVHYLVVLHASRTGRTRNPYFEGPFQQRFRFTESANVRKSEPGVAMLSGFTFRFADNDHHLRKIAIDPEPLDSFGVTFTDDERDHAVDGFLEYVLAIPYIW